MNTSDLADQISTAHGLTKADAKKVVDSVFTAIGDAAAKGDEVSVPGFGKFKVKDSPEREGRNPSTGEAIKIAASKSPKFSAGATLKAAVNPKKK